MTASTLLIWKSIKLNANIKKKKKLKKFAKLSCRSQVQGTTSIMITNQMLHKKILAEILTQ